MLPVNLSFHRMLLKYVPNLNEQEIREIESLMALRHQVSEEIRIFEQNSARTAAMNNLNMTISNLVAPHLTFFNTLVRLYAARRAFALQSGHYQQIPSTWADLTQFVQAAFYLLYVEIISFPLLVWGYVQNNNPGAQVIISLVALVAFIFGFSAINYTPQIISTPVINANVGVTYTYQVTAVDSSAFDILTYSLPVQPGFLSINGFTGLVSGLPADTGSYTIKIRVTDLAGATDIQDYQIHISP